MKKLAESTLVCRTTFFGGFGAVTFALLTGLGATKIVARVLQIGGSIAEAGLGWRAQELCCKKVIVNWGSHLFVTRFLPR